MVLLADELVEIRTRRALRHRMRPYWEVLEYGRALGYQRKRGEAYWLARIRMRSGNYKQKRLGNTNDRDAADGEKHFDYHQARQLAEAWFSDPEISAIASDRTKRGPTLSMLVCPWGDEYTVTHAIHDLVEWKRLFVARTHFQTMISHINFHIVPRLGTIRLSQFKGTHVQAFIRDVLETPAQPGNSPAQPRRPVSEMSAEELRKRKKTLNALIDWLRQALLMAWENGHVENERAWRCIRYLPNVDRPRIVFANRHECRQLLDACAPDIRDLVLAGMYTGCRISELLLMTVGDYVPDRYGLNVPLVKTRRPRFVFLPDEGCELFERLTAGQTADAPMFVRTDGKRWSDDYRHHFKVAVNKAGLTSKFSFHSLRHTYASQLIQAGTPLIVISDQLEHVSTNTVSRTYGHMAPQIREAEVRQRFTPITGTPVTSPIVRNRPAPYAIISDLRAVQD